MPSLLLVVRTFPGGACEGRARKRIACDNPRCSGKEARRAPST